MTNLTLGFDRVLRPGKLRAVALGVLLATGVAMGHDATYAAGHGAAQKPIRLAVLGDSDSHAYQDPLANGFGTAQARGGSWQGSTLQWTELLGRLRADEIEQGSFGPVGRQGPLAWLMRHTGFGPVRQKKQDFAFNFSYNGATCADLTRSDFGQAHLLTALLDSEPPAWSNRAAVLIRIGINDLGKREQMAQFARSGLDQAARKRVDQCADAVSAAMALVRTRHPGVLLIVVGILDNADWPPLHDQWQDPAPLGRIAAVLDAYDDRLRQAVAATPNAVFIDDRAQFRSEFGGRDGAGRPAYRVRSFGGVRSLTVTRGDDPRHLVLEDGHAGTLWNGYWANGLLAALNQHFGTTIAPLTETELLPLADPDNRSGLRPAAATAR